MTWLEQGQPARISVTFPGEATGRQDLLSLISRYDYRSENCYAYSATIERESTKLRAMRNGLDSLSWDLMWTLDEHDREGQREYHRKIGEQTARVIEQENYLRKLQDQAAVSDGT